jgi:glycine cleavage system H protein
MYPEGYLYTKDHEWTNRDGEACTVGITHFAQDQLGEIVYLELPEPGDTVEAGDQIGSIESVKAVAELYSPVSGEVEEINEEAVDDPAVVNSDPHGAGWLLKIRLSSPEQLDGLMSASQYQEFADSGQG